jgi:hypothetical protein
MKKENHWEFRYRLTTANGHEIEKVCYPCSKEQIEKNKDACRRAGYTFVSCKKLYPFNTWKNQHNFELINNICHIRMGDMESGEIPYDNDEYIRLEELQKKAERLFCAPLPTAWLTWEDWKDAKELSEMAILHRQNACIEAGRYDLVAYC